MKCSGSVKTPYYDIDAATLLELLTADQNLNARDGATKRCTGCEYSGKI